MNEIICPYCDKAVTVDEDGGYADTIQQVRDNELAGVEITKY